MAASAPCRGNGLEGGASYRGSNDGNDVIADDDGNDEAVDTQHPSHNHRDDVLHHNLCARARRNTQKQEWFSVSNDIIAPTASAMAIAVDCGAGRNIVLWQHQTLPDRMRAQPSRASHLTHLGLLDANGRDAHGSLSSAVGGPDAGHHKRNHGASEPQSRSIRRAQRERQVGRHSAEPSGGQSALAQHWGFLCTRKQI